MLIDDLMNDAENAQVIDIVALKKGAIIHIQTRNTLYQIELIDPQTKEAKVIGHDKFDQIHITGCTWGGSALWMGKLSDGMYMEFVAANKRYTTSCIEKIIVIEVEEK